MQSLSLEKAIDIIQETVKVNEIKKWTDGCAAQNKRKNCFFDISNQSMTLTRNYFETSHGKNVCDGLGAVVKCSCYRAMLSGKVLGDAKAVYSRCNETLLNTNECENKTGCKSVSLRQFVFVCMQLVTRNNTPVVDTVKGIVVDTVKGIRKIHSIKNIGSPGKIAHRNLSCEATRPCMNTEYVGKWEEIQIQNHR